MSITNLKLHQNMDASRKDIFKPFLYEKCYDVTRTPNKKTPEDASDEIQLIWATSHHRIIFPFNIKDFIYLSKDNPFHSGQLLVNQSTTNISQQIQALRKILSETINDTWIGKVRWIRDCLK
jgi:hypothetical protein